MAHVQTVVPEQKCTGCFACYNVCPTDAIRMQLNAEGFFVPKVSHEKCINCGKCVKTCPVLEKNVFLKEPSKEAWSFQGEDDIRQKSSSGGAFYYIAQSVLKTNGVVFGAAFDTERQIVRHMSTDEVPLERLMRSKYVQSEVGDTYRRVKECLKQGRKVLFAGTPCQVKGLKFFLGKPDENLLTVDFICHGVPSTGIFMDNIQSEENKAGKRVVDVTFREKDQGWRKQVVKFYFDDKTVKCQESVQYFYYFAFLNSITLRRSCFECSLPRDHRADITLLDYWQVQSDDDKGVSACYLNTPNGERTFFEACQNRKPIQLNLNITGVTPHGQVRSYKEVKWLRNYFFKVYSKNGMDTALKKAWPLCKMVLKIRKEFYRTAGKVRNILQGKS